jgi:predicted permease
MFRNIRVAIRALLGTPGFTVTAALSIGLGIGLGASIYSQLEALVFRPAPGVTEPESLVAVNRPVSFPAYEAFRDGSGQFREAAAYMGPVALAWKDNGPPARIWGHFVTPNYFRVLGATTIAGRVFGDTESGTRIAPVAVVTERLWHEKMNSDPAVVGRTMKLNGKPVTVIGIAAAGFHGASPMLAPADVFIPLTVESSFAPELDETIFHDNRKTPFSVLGRLSSGVTRPEAQAALDTVVRRFIERRPGEPETKGRLITLLPGGRQIPVRDEDLGAILGVPLVLVGLILWIACSNVGTMVLARFGSRRREIAIRLAIGSSRGRVIRQLMIESFVVALLGGFVGLALAYLVNRSYASFRDVVPGLGDVDLRISWGAVLFIFVLSLGSGMMFGLVPALRATRADLVQTLKPGSKWQLARFRWFSWRNILVLQQVAGSLALLLLTGFIVLGFRRVTSVDVGIQTPRLYMMSLDPVRDGYTTERASVFFAGLKDRVRRMPGVADAALSYTVPIGLRSQTASGQMRDQFDAIDSPERLTTTVEINRVGPGFFETTGLPILRGRALVDNDAPARRVVVNETMAKQNWSDESPIGRTIELGGRRYEVAGVAKDINVYLMGVVPPTVFELMSPDDYRQPSAQGITLLVRGVPGADVSATVQRELTSTDPDLTVFNVTTADHEVAQAMYIARYSVMIYGGIGLFGLVLSAVGLAGVTAYTVVQRTKEIGIRVALGATKMDVLRLVTREGFALVGIGATIGFAAAFAIMRGLAAWINAVSQITKTSAADPLLIAGAPLLLISLTMIACIIPARRSLYINPVVALREE